MAPLGHHDIPSEILLSNAQILDRDCDTLKNVVGFRFIVFLHVASLIRSVSEGTSETRVETAFRMTF